ncbi:ATP-binding cassette sub-family A member 13-like [Ixodes scapularis]
MAPSGGNKRKLSVAAAFIGLPEIVFLDEPSAGVDILARQKIFSSLQAFRSKSGLSLVLTSHSMDECELACDRIGIMVAGQFKCLGSLQHLKNKFGTGYSLNLRLEDGSAVDLDAFVAEVQRVFPGIQLRARHEDTFEYHMEEKLLWSVLFTKVEELERKFKLAHVLASDSTLEQIFIQFAREQDSKAEQGTSVAKGPVLQNAVPRGLHPDRSKSKESSRE